MSVCHEDWVQRIAVRPLPLDTEVLKEASQNLWRSFKSIVRSWIADGHTFPPADSWKTPPIPFSMRSPNGEIKKFSVELVTKPRYSKRSSGSIGGYYDHRAGTITLEYYYFKDFEDREMGDSLYTILPSDGQALTDIFQTLSHEVTHALEPQLTKNPIQPVDLDSTLEYFNQPHEVRAYMQEIARQVANHLEHQEINPKDQSRWLKQGLESSSRWQSVQRFLVPANRKKILQGVVRYLQDAGIFT